MTPDDEILLLHAYRDGELSPGEVLAMEHRLAADPALRAMADRLDALSGAVRGALATPPASPALHRRVLAGVAAADGVARRTIPRPWRALAAVLIVGLLAGGVLGSGATYVGLGPGSEATGDAVLAGHLRGLVAQQPFDIASSNRHVVKPWFNGRTTIAPDAPDFADRGFPLAGGRIDIVDGKAVPTLVYRHDQHVVSVTVTPRTAGAPAGEERRGGSTIERWSVGDLTYWIVSDLDPHDLRAFSDLFRIQVAHDG